MNNSSKIFRVLVFNQFYPPDYAATGQFIQELATDLSLKNIKITVFSGQPGYASDVQKAPRNERKGRLKIRRSSILTYYLTAFLQK